MVYNHDWLEQQLKAKSTKVIKKVERFDVVLELYDDNQYLITLKSGKTFWVSGTDLEDIAALTKDIHQ